jgi:hypothetical protein
MDASIHKHTLASCQYRVNLEQLRSKALLGCLTQMMNKIRLVLVVVKHQFSYSMAIEEKISIAKRYGYPIFSITKPCGNQNFQSPKL